MNSHKKTEKLPCAGAAVHLTSSLNFSWPISLFAIIFMEIPSSTIRATSNPVFSSAAALDVEKSNCMLFPTMCFANPHCFKDAISFIGPKIFTLQNNKKNTFRKTSCWIFCVSLTEDSIRRLEITEKKSSILISIRLGHNTACQKHKQHKHLS